MTTTTEPRESATAGWAAELFGVIYEPGDIVEIRPLLPSDEKSRAGRRWVQAGDIGGSRLVEWMQAANDDGHCIYFGANPRRSQGVGKAEDVLLARCLFADFDGGVEVEDALARIELAGKPWPTAIVRSGNGVHPWWRLDEPITDMAAWTRCQKRLAADLGSDSVVSDPPRLMRVPGYVNTKYEHRPLASLVEVTGEVYGINDILPGGIPPVPLAFKSDTTPVQAGSMSRQTRRFLDEGYVFAKGGRRCTAFTAACDLKARGWKLADAQREIMKAVPKLGLTSKEAADIPRQIASAFSRVRTPIADRGVFATDTVIATTQHGADDGAANVGSPRTWNDTGMALRIVRESRGTIRYVVDRGIWVRWTGKHWEDDAAAAEAQRIAKAVGVKLWDEMHAVGRAIPLPGVRFVMNAANRRAIDAAIALARSEPPVEVRSAAFDADADAMNVANGILNLRTRQLQPHDPAAMLTKLAGVQYVPGAACPKWIAFIDAVTCGDKLLAGFLQRSFGLALSADQSEQRLWIHHGEGSNGKGTALAVLHRVFGTYAGPAPVEILLARRHDGDREIGVAKLAGKRLAFAQEADDGVRLSEATVKALTGSDPLTGRFLYQNNFEVLPTWHLHLAVNDRPSIRGTDHGIWRRVTLVPWSHTFTDAEKRPRAVVEAELLAEGPGILNWLLDGYESWRADGLRPPAAVDAATSEYRSESDSVRAWIADACTVEAGAETPATDLFVNYRDWCRRAGDRGVSQTKFGRTLDALGHGKELPRSGLYRDRTVRMGLRIVHRHEDIDAEPAYSSPMDARF